MNRRFNDRSPPREKRNVKNNREFRQFMDQEIDQREAYRSRERYEDERRYSSMQPKDLNNLGPDSDPNSFNYSELKKL